MSNMSYCRFQNTLKDFRDCEQALADLAEGRPGRALSEDELIAAKDLLVTAVRLVYELCKGADEVLDEIEPALDRLQAQHPDHAEDES